RAVSDQGAFQIQRNADPPMANPIRQPEGVRSNCSSQRSHKASVPGQTMPRADTEVKDEEGRQQQGHQQRVGEPAQKRGKRYAEQAKRTWVAVIAEQLAGLGQDKHSGQEQVRLPRFQRLTTGASPPREQPQAYRQASSRASQADASGRCPEQPGYHGPGSCQTHFVGRGVVKRIGRRGTVFGFRATGKDPGSHGQGKLGGSAATVKDGGLGITSIKSGIEASQGAALVQSAGAESSVIQMQRMTS